MTKFTLILVLASLFLCRFAVAQEYQMKGRVYLGLHMDLLLEEREGFIKEGFRWLGLLQRPRPVKNLTKLGLYGDRLFFAADGKLYCKKVKSPADKGKFFRIGDPVRLGNIRMDKTVKLSRVKMVFENIDASNKAKEILKVHTPPALLSDTQIKQANFSYWLDELVFAYDGAETRKRKDDNYGILEKALRTGLPMRDDDSQARLENLKHLQRFVERESPEKLPPVRNLVDEKIREVTALKGRDQQNKDMYEPILKAYRKLAVQLREKTYDL